jgi:TolA-binding protein
MNSALLVMVSIMMLAGGCFTPNKEQKINDEFHEVKTRLLELERIATERGATTDASTKRIASTHSELERINLDLQRIKGELESLKLMASTGEAPGASPETDSVAKRIRDLATRIETLELSASAKPAIAAASASTSTKGVSVREIKDAFNSKKFSFVIANADLVLSRVKTKATREEISYFAAESLFRTNRYREAALKFNDFSEQFPTSQRLLQVKMRLGDSFRNLGDKNAAKSFYREIIAKHPKSTEASRAKDLLDGLEDKGSSR